MPFINPTRLHGLLSPSRTRRAGGAARNSNGVVARAPERSIRQHALPVHARAVGPRATQSQPHSPRAASVVATERCKCWALDRETFKRILMGNAVRRNARLFVRSCVVGAVDEQREHALLPPREEDRFELAPLGLVMHRRERETTRAPARSSAAILSFAVPFPPETMAPACPMRRPGGAEQRGRRG